MARIKDVRFDLLELRVREIGPMLLQVCKRESGGRVQLILDPREADTLAGGFKGFCIKQLFLSLLTADVLSEGGNPIGISCEYDPASFTVTIKAPTGK